MRENVGFGNSRGTPCAMDLSATDSSAMAWRSTQQRRIAAESTEEREARLHQLSVTQRQRIAAESTEEREARLQQLRIYSPTGIITKIY